MRSNSLVSTLLSRLALMAMLLGFWPSAAVAQPGEPWQVLSVTGDARLGGAALGEGQALVPGDAVETGADGRVVLAQGPTRVTISPNSRTEIPAGEAAERTTLFQAIGTLLLSVERRMEQHFEVQTPYLAAVVKGTTFTVSVNTQGSSVHVVEGLVEVGSFASGSVSQVRPGQTATVSSQAGGGVRVIGQLAPSRDQSGETESLHGESQGEALAAESAGGSTAGEAAAATAGPPPQPIGRAAEASRSLADAATTRGSRAIVLDRTLGAGKLDLSTLTGGLIRNAPPRAQRAALGASDVDASSAGGEGAKGRGGLGGLGNGRAKPGNPGQAIANLVQSTASPGSPSRALGNGGGNGLALGLGNGNSNAASVSAGNSNGLALGLGSGSGNSKSNGLSLGLGNGNGIGNDNGNSNGNGNGNGLALGLGNGNGLGLGLGNGNGNSNGNGLDLGNGNGNSNGNGLGLGLGLGNGNGNSNGNGLGLGLGNSNGK